MFFFDKFTVAILGKKGKNRTKLSGSRNSCTCELNHIPVKMAHVVVTVGIWQEAVPFAQKIGDGGPGP